MPVFEGTGLPSPLGYPPAPVLPSPTPLPGDYVPPPTARSSQLATMTPAYQIPSPEDESQALDQGSTWTRLSLYFGFIAALVILLVSLIVLLRWKRGGEVNMPPDGFENQGQDHIRGDEG